MNNLPRIANGESIALEKIPVFEMERFRQKIIDLIKHQHARCVSFFAMPDWQTHEQLRLCVILAVKKEKKLIPFLSEKLNTVFFQSLTNELPQMHLFEREIAEQWGLTPIGHPWLKPIRFHQPYRFNPDGNDPFGRTKNNANLVGKMSFFSIPSEDIHEVGVGPIHAGVIEPGHFRFLCHGETVFNLEISLGYQHRAIEPMLRNGPHANTRHLIETIAGDSSIAYSINYARIIENLAHLKPTIKGTLIRSILLELERLANHTGDVGALANDIAYLPSASFCGRIRGDFLNLTASICGNRFGRRAVVPGGTACHISDVNISALAAKLRKSAFDVDHAAKCMNEAPSVIERFDNCGIVSSLYCKKMGIVGLAARASGVALDTRADYPFDLFTLFDFAAVTRQTGDVQARFFTRWLEMQASSSIIINTLANFPDGESCAERPAFDEDLTLDANRLVVSLCEAWRGELAHVAVTNDAGKFHVYKVVDPSFHNWSALMQAMRNERIYNFPLCNKSFNLSYCGHDL